MSSNVARGSTAPSSDEAAITAYLESHPDFFERHPNALARLKLPHARGAAVSLIERQVEVLRDKHAAMEQKLAEFVHVARANDQLADKIHRFTRRLLRAGSLAATLTELEASLREDFDAFNARLVLIGPADAALRTADLERFLRTAAGDDAALRSFDSLFESAKPRCGQVRDSQREYLFGSDAGGIASVALVPLLRTSTAGVVTPVGLLAVGSNDPARFHPGMSTEFLARMGDLITDAVQRFR
ncbi:MAG: DUF484 family protein [Steroidobacteraceae bacterium]